MVVDVDVDENLALTWILSSFEAFFVKQHMHWNLGSTRFNPRKDCSSHQCFGFKIEALACWCALRSRLGRPSYLTGCLDDRSRIWVSLSIQFTLQCCFDPNRLAQTV